MLALKAHLILVPAVAVSTHASSIERRNACERVGQAATTFITLLEELVGDRNKHAQETEADDEKCGVEQVVIHHFVSHAYSISNDAGWRRIQMKQLPLSCGILSRNSVAIRLRRSSRFALRAGNSLA